MPTAKGRKEAGQYNETCSAGDLECDVSVWLCSWPLCDLEMISQGLWAFPDSKK